MIFEKPLQSNNFYYITKNKRPPVYFLLLSPFRAYLVTLDPFFLILMFYFSLKRCSIYFLLYKFQSNQENQMKVQRIPINTPQKINGSTFRGGLLQMCGCGPQQQDCQTDGGIAVQRKHKISLKNKQSNNNRKNFNFPSRDQGESRSYKLIKNRFEVYGYQSKLHRFGNAEFSQNNKESNLRKLSIQRQLRLHNQVKHNKGHQKHLILFSNNSENIIRQNYEEEFEKILFEETSQLSNQNHRQAYQNSSMMVTAHFEEKGKFGSSPDLLSQSKCSSSSSIVFSQNEDSKLANSSIYKTNICKLIIEPNFNSFDRDSLCSEIISDEDFTRMMSKTSLLKRNQKLSSFP